MSASPQPQEVPVVEMAGVTVSAREDLSVTVLEDVNWKVAAGAYWVIAGMHNSGKTDLLAMAAGLTPPQKGDYRLFGEAMPGEVGGRTRLRGGLDFDGGKPLHRLSIAENVALPLKYHRETSEAETARRVAALLELTGLSAWANRMPGTIGRAWEKRLGLARALALEPELLLLDDPLGGLDTRHVNWWMGIMDELSAGHPLCGKRRMTLVAATNNLKPWRNRPVRVALLRQRRFEAQEHGGPWRAGSDPLLRELLEETPETK